MTGTVQEIRMIRTAGGEVVSDIAEQHRVFIQRDGSLVIYYQGYWSEVEVEDNQFVHYEHVRNGEQDDEETAF